MAGTFCKGDKINCYHCRLFRSVAKPRPCDHPLMMLFIVGGITTSEVKQIRDTVNLYKPDTQVNLSSSLLSARLHEVQRAIVVTTVVHVPVTLSYSFGGTGLEVKI